MKHLKPNKIGIIILLAITVVLTIHSCDSDDDTASESSTEIPDIQPKISAEKGFAIAGESLSFKYAYDTIPNYIESYSWTFEGGSPESSTDAEPLVTYSNEGVFEATMTIIRAEDGKEFTGKLDVRVLENANTAFMADIQKIEQGNKVTFRSMSSSSDNLKWVFEGGTPENASSEEVIVTYNTPGVFDVTLSSTLNGSKTSVTEADYIEVTAQPEPTFDVSATTVNQRESITFTNTTPGTSEANVKWIFTGGDVETVTGQEASVTYPEAGVFDVTLEITKNGITKSIENKEYITVNDVIENAFFQSAQTTTDGSKVIIAYDQPLNDPASETIKLSVNNQEVDISSISLDPDDNTKIVLTLVSPISSETAIISATYENPTITTPDGGTVEMLSDKPVQNNYLNLTLNRFPTGDFEGITTNQYDVNNGFQGSGNVSAISADFVDGSGLDNTRGLVYTVTGAVDGDRRAIFGDKDANAIQLITPIRPGVTYTIKASIKYTGVKPSKFELGVVNYPWKGSTLVFGDVDITNLVEGQFVEVQGSITIKEDTSDTGYAIPRLTAGTGDSVVTVDNIQVLAQE